MQIDANYGNAEHATPIVAQFHQLLADVSKVTGKAALELASNFEHLNTELVCYLCSQARKEPL